MLVSALCGGNTQAACPTLGDTRSGSRPISPPPPRPFPAPPPFPATPGRPQPTQTASSHTPALVPGAKRPFLFVLQIPYGQWASER